MKVLLTAILFFGLNCNAGIPLFFKTQKETVVKKGTTTCTDFTGNWSGHCTYSETPRTEPTATHTNLDMLSCDSLQMDNVLYAINGTRTETISNRHSTTTNVISFEWNDIFDKKFIKFSIDSKQILFGLAEREGWSSAGTIKISNEKLVIEQKKSTGETTSCEFSKN